MTLDELIKKLLELRRYYKQNTNYEDILVVTHDDNMGFYCEIEDAILWAGNQVLIEHA